MSALRGRMLQAIDIDVWLARPDRILAPGLLRWYEGLLSPEERERHRAFLVEPRRHEYLVTRALVRTALSRYLPVPPAAWRFTANPHGRPDIDPPCGLRFNLSNAPTLVACAVTRQDVGIDLEPYARGEAVLALSGRVFSARERGQLERRPETLRPRYALSLWTLKEAYAKARGVGLTLPLQQIEFVFDDPSRIHLELGPALDDDPRRWAFRLLDWSGHRVALAAREVGRVRCAEITPQPGDAEGAPDDLTAPGLGIAGT